MLLIIVPNKFYQLLFLVNSCKQLEHMLCVPECITFEIIK